MNKLIDIQSGTIFVDGVRYNNNNYPPPNYLIKVMERCWADCLLYKGAIRLGSLNSYRGWENAILGDPNDGKGMLRMNTHPYEFGSSIPVYAWCAALLTITPERINILADHGKYDCIVRVLQPSELIRRLHLAKPKDSYFHCAEVSYNRGEEVDKLTLNSQRFHFNVFQKDLFFVDDQEYRIALIDVSHKPDRLDYIDLSIGDCSDIMAIEELPGVG